MSVLLAFPLLLTAWLPQESLHGQLPKQDLGVDRFLQTHPEYDGRGVRIAVLDTGVDPGHPLLQRTSTGTRKLVDWYDATSDGRLALETRRLAEQGQLVGLSGRRLDLGRWAIAGQEYFLARIDRDFLPQGLADRILADRKTAWTEEKRRFEEAEIRGVAERLASSDADDSAGWMRVEMARRWESFDDPGPVYDVVVFQDEDEHWRVVVDNDEDGDLGEEPGLRDFRASGDWAVLGDEALLNYGAHVDAEREQVVFFYDTNGHGTHVAGIIGAHGGEGHRLNGLAPGVELVAIKIGDGKYGAATSGFSIAKALDYALEAGCQAVNISFGGPAFFADGEEPDAWVIDEATRRGLIVVTSAGNEGPTLSTVGAPATSSAAFSIAAAIWPDTQKANYGSLHPSQPVLFDFSSRGPLPDGSFGISFTAPGAALSTLPSWLITPAENFNGTSMAAPQATGAIALLLSAARSEQLAASPERIRRALRIGAAELKGFAPIEQGHGYLQVLPSLEALRKLAVDDDDEMAFDVKVQNPHGVGAGIYERDLAEEASFERSVRIQPIFADEATHAEQAAFLRSYRIEADRPWIRVPEATYLTHGGRSFSVRIDPKSLKPGLHVGRVRLFDVDRPEAVGAEIVVPVTIVKAHTTSATSQHRLVRRLKLQPGELERTFVRVPHGARKARILLTQSGSGRNEFRTGAGTVSGFLHPGDRQQRGRIFLEDGQQNRSVVPVEAGTVFEYTVASRWAVNRPVSLQLEVEFVGLEPQTDVVRVPVGQGVAYAAVRSPLRSENLNVSAQVVGLAVPVDAAMQIEADPIRATIFDGMGMFYGVREWTVEVPADGTEVAMHMPASIQTIELREDLMLEIRDASERIVKRTIVFEVDTELGAMDAGAYRFKLMYPSLGRESLAMAYAGAEVRLATVNKSVSLYGSLKDAFREEHAISTLALPYSGVRSVMAQVPELDPVPPGAYYYGHLRYRSGGDTVLETPLRVDRAIRRPLEDLVAEGQGESAREAYLEGRGQGASPRERVDLARAWSQGEPGCYEARLAVLESLSEAGLERQAQHMGLDFLRLFPARANEFLQIAAGWYRD